MRSLGPISVSRSIASQHIEARSELDSHADQSIVGEAMSLIIQDFEQPVTVKGYDGKTAMDHDRRTVSAVVAYDHPRTGETFYLIIHQAILIERITHNLLSTMQMRDHDIRVNDEPKHMVPNPTEDHHAIVVPHWRFPETDEPFRIPCTFQGVSSYFPTRKPTREEYENADLDHCIELTDGDNPWDPHSDRFRVEEEAMLDSKGQLRERVSKETVDRVVSALQAYQTPLLHDLGSALQGTVHVRTVSTVAKPKQKHRTAHRVTIRAVKTARQRFKMEPARLAKNWGISLNAARKALEATTMKGVWTTLHPTLSRRFRTNDRQLRYRRLSHDMFTDTLESKVTSWHRKNRYAQVFATRFGWVRVFPMRTKSAAHEGLSLLAQRDGVPPVLVMDGAREQTMGEFRRKAREMGTRVKQTEPYSPWQNAAESAIREVKRAAGRRMSKMGAPAKLWDHCLELFGYIRSNTANDSYELQGQVPETVLSGQTADISPFIELGWYDWVKYWDSNSAFPEPKERLG